MEENIFNIINNNQDKLIYLATRKGFGEGLLLLGKNNNKVVALSADLTESTQVEAFKVSYPDRFFEMGVSEQNMASVASGMASSGLIPFITSYAMFSPGRNWEQIRTTICYNNVPVKIIGCHAGVSVGPDGGTHQALEDIALMRVIPNIIVVIPCDAIEAKKATIEISKIKKPAYLRLFREKSAIITNEQTKFEIGKANIIYETKKDNQKKVGIIACGEMVYKSLTCVKELEEKDIEVGILNLHTIKPLDENAILDFAKKYKNILTCEEHQIACGMGSSILELFSKNNIFGSEDFSNLKFKMLGVEDRFGQSGEKEELFKEYNLDKESILKKVLEFFN